MRSRGIFKILWILVLLPLLGCDQQSKEEKEVYGVVNSRFITGRSVKERFNLTQLELSRLNPNEKKSYFSKLSEEYILEHESKKIKMPISSLLDFFEEINPKQISQSEMKSYKERFPESKNVSHKELVKQIRVDRVARAKIKYQAELRQRSTVKNFLEQAQLGL